MENLKKTIKKEFKEAKDKIEFLNALHKTLHELHPFKHNPVSNIQWVKIDRIKANEYNPNTVAMMELELLHTSIDHDGYTQPIVTVRDNVLRNTNDNKSSGFVIVDGFHRFYVMKSYKDLLEKNDGYLPITIIDKDINDRMASTIRHNRARGRHMITGMSNLVFSLLEQGWDDIRICKELGMEKEELIRLKHITGFSKLFENQEYKKAWLSKKQLAIKKKWEDKHGKKSDL